MRRSTVAEKEIVMSRLHRTLGVAIVVVALLPSDALARQRDPLDNSKLKRTHFEDLAYPTAAQESGVQGVVVVESALDDTGRVVNPIALTGHPLLAPVAVDNARRWSFEPSAQKRAVIVYDFRLEGACRKPGNGLSRVLDENYVQVLGCTALGDASRLPLQADEAPVRYTDLTYHAVAQSARIQGLVVIEATVSIQGDVVATSVVSGKMLLDKHAAQHALTLGFPPASSTTHRILVYRFISSGGWCRGRRGGSIFDFVHPALLSVTACSVPVDH